MKYSEALYVPGQRACPGCGVNIAVRLILEAAGPEVVIVTPTGCLETFSSPYPYAPWGVPWLHVLFENGGAVATGVRAALKRRGLGQRVKVVVIGGDGGTFDIGLGALSGMLERGDDVTYICYDNEAYMNTGVQSSSATPLAASTMTSPTGKVQPKKNLAAIALAHNIPYVASASIGYPKDLQKKIKRALSIEGPKFIELHSPCPIGWGFDASRTVEVARLAAQTGLFPIYEAGYDLPLAARKITKRLPVDDYLRTQTRFRSLFEDEAGRRKIADIQSAADENIAQYKLTN